MQANFREGITQVLQSFPPGSMLADKQGHYWVRWETMAITRHRFISHVGDDQEKYYEQKYLLNVDLTDEDILVCWLDNTANPTWEAVAEALYLMDAHTVAHSIRKYM